MRFREGEGIEICKIDKKYRKNSVYPFDDQEISAKTITDSFFGIKYFSI